ncbi:hypothetical protein PPERSA_04731 [Pseudocohnilembus persalinus]|uniref:Uncharacterized protein n=1 Tax=Pseudocohnilembus persalinus TaxID=266149 RepID=A0A0V0R4L9_PSEPJ|nr:hypothetical protein PPERSA_04731 [Pseudocohnilembus persalinus]|eukprot:KRX09425.1 hypothetical protein PPERSA_04731 [Pseudocohnilembus persalinus]
MRDKLGLQVNSQKEMRDFLLFQNKELLIEKIQELEEINDNIEKEINCMRHHEVFWQWMESVIDVDKKDWIDDQDYGFSENDIINLQMPKDKIQAESCEISMLAGNLSEILGLLNDYQQQQKIDQQENGEEQKNIGQTEQQLYEIQIKKTQACMEQIFNQISDIIQVFPLKK